MSVDLDPKRDDGEELSDRLTDNAYHNILPNRYLSADEEPEDLFPRVAKNVAVAEAVYADEEVTVRAIDVKPDHPRRDELVEDVFDTETRDQNGLEFRVNGQWEPWSELNEAGRDLLTTELTEDIAPNFAFDTVVERAPDETEEKMRDFAERAEEMMSYLKFMPNSPTLMNAGDELQQLSACFVDSPDDDIDDIHQTAKEAAQVFQSGGGMGYAFWQLRPYGDQVGSTDGIASGPITFMETYDQMCETIAQGGARRGAQMGVMRVSHPDIIEFIHAKNKDVSLAHSLRLNDPDDFEHSSFEEALEEARDILEEHSEDGHLPKMFRNAVEGHLSNFNISVGITDEFMEAYQNGEDFTFTNPQNGEPHIATEETKELYERWDLGEYVEVGEPLSIPAEEIMEDIVEGAHENGEPGVIYLERVNKEHSFDVEEHPDHQILATNPCGEQPLEEYEACNLGHINLSTIVREDADTQYWGEFTGEDVVDIRTHIGERPDDLQVAVGQFLTHAIDWDEFDARIELGTRFLENVVTMSKFPVDEISEKVSEMRKIGLGVMGLAQLYIQLGVPYGSEVGDEIAEQLMVYINHESKRVSRELADERGVFDEWDKSKFANPTEYREWFEHHTGEDADDWEDGFPMRNHNTTTIAPTGTTSMIGNTSGGCEPIFSVAHYKNVSQDVQGDEPLVEFDDYFLRTLENNGVDVRAAKEECERQMENNEFDGVNGLETVPDEIGEFFVTTSQLSAEQHASVQVACQKGVDSAISKTVNAPNESTIEDAKEVFEYIYERGGKGVTYYRDGTRSKQVLTTRKDNKEFADDEELVDVVTERIEEDDGFLEELSDELTSEQVQVLRDVDDSDLLDVEATIGKTEEDEPWYENGHYAEKRERPNVLYGPSQRVNTGYGRMYVNISLDEEGRPFEIFVNMDDSGSVVNGFVEALAKSVSVALRSGVNPKELANELIGIKAPDVGYSEEYGQVQSIPDGIGKALKRVAEGEIEVREPEAITDGSGTKTSIDNTGVETPEVSVESSTPSIVKEDCWCDNPEATQNIVMNEGCQECTACGWSKC